MHADASMHLRMSKLEISLWLVFSVAAQFVTGQQRILYVKTSDSSPCPDDVSNDDCQTLDQYSHNILASFTSDTTMVLLEGSHSLSTFIKVDNCHNFTMVGRGKAMYTSEGQLRPTSWINCSREGYNAGLLFNDSSNITIANLGLDSCSGKVVLTRHFTVHVAVAFNRVKDVIINQVYVNNTKGFGLQCDGVFGHIIVTDSVFANSHGDRAENIFGGNARFWFGSPCSNFSTKLVIQNSEFLYGKEKQKNKYVNASGLQVMIFCRGINALIDNITTRGNWGNYGGNIALSLTGFASRVSSITIRNSKIIEGHAQTGGGIRFWSQIHVEDTSSNDIEQVKFKHDYLMLTIFNCIFYKNHAQYGGSAIYIAHYVTKNYHTSLLRKQRIVINNCKFQRNTGRGSVLKILKQTFPDYIKHVTPQFSVHINSGLIENNRASSDLRGSVVELIGTKSVRLSNCTFRNNYGSVFSLRNSNVNFHQAISFTNNTAVYGGALRVCDSSLIFLHLKTKVLFHNNRAEKGGAVYAQQGCLETVPACLFQPVLTDYNFTNLKELGKFIKVKFVNNTASLAGDAIYGGSFDNCYTLLPAKYYYENESYNYYHNEPLFQEIFVTGEQKGPSNISSDPRGVCFCDSVTGSPTCRDNVSLSVFPGQIFNVLISTVGQANKATVGLIDANLVSQHSQDQIVSFNNSLRSHSGCTNLTYKVVTKSNQVKINFTAVTYDANAYYTSTNATLLLRMLPCPFGFKLIDGRCDCDPLLQQNIYSCSIDRVKIHASASQIPQWFGCIKNTDGDGSDNCSHRSLVVSTFCDQYCTSSEFNVDVTNLTTIDAQCLPGRTGVICASCKPGLSRVLGDVTKCKQCNNLNIVFLIPAFLFSGISVVALLLLLNMTVTEGTISGLIFYANILYTHQPVFTNTKTRYTILGKICWTFIAVLNFDVGFELCSFNGMQGYQQIWLTYGYMFYLIFLQATIILLCRKFIFFTRIFGRNIVKVLATIVYLMYSPLVNAMILTFQGTHLHISKPNGIEQRLVWYFDGNVTYFSSKHLPLFIVAVICSVVIMWLTFSLLLIQCLQKRANLWCFKWVEKLRPFFDAFTGPCHDNYRFWPGFLLLMRTMLHILNTVIHTFSSTSHQRQLTPIGTTMICVVIFSFSCIFPRGVYKKWLLNVLEFWFFLNLCLTSVVWSASGTHNKVVVYISVLMVMCTSAGIICYHMVVRLRSNLKVCECLKKIFRSKYHTRLCCCTHSRSGDDETTLLLPQPLPPVVDYKRYREPLIEN